MQVSNQIEHPIHKLLAERWSPRSLDANHRLVDEEIYRLFEAARWAPSSYNAQPWAFWYASKQDTTAFQALWECLLPSNQLWVKNASMLVVGMAKQHFEHNGQQNRYASYDLGAAVMAISLQAQAMGLAVHQLGGYDPQKLAETITLPEDHEAVVMLAVGKRTAKELLPEPLQVKELPKKPRRRVTAFAKAFEPVKVKV